MPLDPASRMTISRRSPAFLYWLGQVLAGFDSGEGRQEPAAPTMAETNIEIAGRRLHAHTLPAEEHLRLMAL